MVKHIEIGIAGRNMRHDSELWIRDTATELGIKGTVCTRSDGTISISAEGEEETLTYFAESIEKGGMFDEIDNFYANLSEANNSYEDFFVVTN